MILSGLSVSGRMKAGLLVPPVVTYATWNPLDKDSNLILTNGNLTTNSTAWAWSAVRATIGKSAGKWYWEVTSSSSSSFSTGIANSTFALANALGGAIDSTAFAASMWTGATFQHQSLGYQIGTNITMHALDMDNHTLYMGINGSWGTGVPTSGNTPVNPTLYGFTGVVFPAVSMIGPSNAAITANFGATGFSYTPPAGFSAIHS